MLGSTVALAAAASFTPSSFTDGGIALVVGRNAAISDGIAAIGLTANLAPTTSTTTTASTVTGGDSYKFEKTSVALNLGTDLAAVKGTLDDSELPTLLADGKYIDNDNDEFDYTQKVDIAGALNISMWDDNDYAEDAPTVGIKIPGGSGILNYTVTFSDTPLIMDLATSDLPIMGKSYYVLSNGTSGTNVILTLLDSADSATIAEGETKTITVNGKTYEVSVDFISSTPAARLVVNGEATNSLANGATQKLSDGAYLGVKEVLYTSKDTGVSKVEFSIGTGKLKLTSGSEVQINDNAVPGLEAVITNSSGTSSDTATLSSIKLVWKADNDVFLTDTTKDAALPEFGTVKLSYGGTKYPTEETVEVKQGSATYAVLENFPLKDGAADIPFLYGVAGGPFSGIGKAADSKLITSNTTSLNFDADTDDNFIVSYSATTEGESYLMKATNFVLDGTNNKTDIQYYKDGAWVTKKAGAKEGDAISMGNAEIGVGYIDRANKVVTIHRNSTATNFWHLYSKEGLRTYLPYSSEGNSTIPGQINFTGGVATVLGANGTSFALQFTEEDKDGNIGSGARFNVSVGWDSSTTAEVQVTALTGVNETGIEIGSTDVERSLMYSALATEFLYSKPTSSQDSIKVIYHGEEVAYDVYANAPSAVVTPIDGGTTTTTGAITVYDNEISSASNKNLIVIGGSCVNTVAAELLGSAACGEAFTTATGIKAGEAIIKSFARSGKVALLVAGYNAEDTTKAVTYLSNNAINTTVGGAGLKVTAANAATAIVTA